MSDDLADAERKALAALQAFARDILADWPEFAGLDGGDIQELAVKHGLLQLKTPAPAEPCSNFSCSCAEYYDAADFADGSVQCYEFTALVGPDPQANAPASEST